MAVKETLVKRSTRNWVAASGLFLVVAPLFALTGCGDKKEETPANAPPPTPPTITTPEGNTKSAMPGGGPQKPGP